MSQYVSPYAYRLPPDTFLQRRDPQWYIGATSESDKREALCSQATAALYKMADTLDAMINAQLSFTTIASKSYVGALIPGLGFVVLASAKNAAEARSFLVTARDKIRKPASSVLGPVEAVCNLARDASVPLAEAKRRIEEFLREYAAALDAQMKLAASSASIFTNAVNAFREGVKTVIEETGGTLLPEGKNVPMWVWAAGGLAGLIAVAYIVGKVAK